MELVELSWGIVFILVGIVITTIDWIQFNKSMKPFLNKKGKKDKTYWLLWLSKPRLIFLGLILNVIGLMVLLKHLGLIK